MHFNDDDDVDDGASDSITLIRICITSLFSLSKYTLR